MMQRQFQRWMEQVPDSVAAQGQRIGRSPWVHLIHVIWSVWVFLMPMLSGGAYGFSLRWLLITAISYPLFLAFYLGTVFGPPRKARLCACAMIAMCLLLLPWYPSGLSYFVFGCVLLPQVHGRLSAVGYIGLLALLNVVLFGAALWLGYPWQALAWIPVVTTIIGVLIMVERMNCEHEAMLKLSQEEVRRLAALAERERIGRDLHDLLGHTLSMVALKSDLAGRLLERDPSAARSEIADVSRVAREALSQVRRAVSGIRAAGIAAELASAKLLLESDGVGFDYRFEDGFRDSALPPGVESALALVVREAATNIQRHARADRAHAVFALESGEAVLRVSDDGRGGAVVPGNGLAGMRERIEGLHGRLRVDRGGERGICVEVRVPLAANDEAPVA